MLTSLKVSSEQKRRQRFIKYGGRAAPSAWGRGRGMQKGSQQMRNANDEIMKKPSPKTKQSLQPAKALKQKVVEHKNKVPPQVCEAQPQGRLHSLTLSLPLPLSIFQLCCCETSLFRTTVHCVCVSVCECAYLIIHTPCLPTKCKNA